jgi:hypothetical protein
LAIVRPVKALNVILTLPFMLGIALGLHGLLARMAKAVAWSALPLATGEMEAFHYERRIYHTAHPEMLQVIGLAAVGGALFWAALQWGPGWLWAVGLLTVLAAVALDLFCWERVSVTANFLWSQRGVRGDVAQVAIENVHELSVEEKDVRGFTLRHGTHNRLCRLQVGLADKGTVELPWTDAYTGLDDVEAMANHVRARQQIRGDRQSLQQAADAATEAARAAAALPTSHDAEMLRELKRLRRGALAPDVPKAAPRK